MTDDPEKNQHCCAFYKVCSSAQPYFSLPSLPACLPRAESTSAFMLDQTGSAIQNRIPQLTIRDLQPFIELAGETGGEVAFGAIRDRSDHPLVRCPMKTAAFESNDRAASAGSKRIRRRDYFEEYNLARDRQDRVEDSLAGRRRRPINAPVK